MRGQSAHHPSSAHHLIAAHETHEGDGGSVGKRADALVHCSTVNTDGERRKVERKRSKETEQARRTRLLKRKEKEKKRKEKIIYI